MQSKKIHIIGIGGTGMNGVAQLAAHAGYQVSGSDRACGLVSNQPNLVVGQAFLYSESLCSSNHQDNTRSRIREARPTTQTNDIFQTLENMGITFFPQDGSGISADTDFAVYSTAIESDNPDIQQSNLLGIPLLHRAEMLAKLCEGNEVIAVAGTAGKSTVTGLLGWIFDCLGKDPTVYCGASMNNFGSSVRYGSGPWIIEADESDRSFLKFHPNHAIITNIAEDHFPLVELHKLFAQFECQVSGIVIRNGEIEGSVLYFNETGTKTLNYRTDPSIDPISPLLGKHNVENIRSALALCEVLGLDMNRCLEAVGSFKGIERRLERVGPKVIDDFAHSPVKIAAALEAVSGEFPAFSVVWRPHGYTPLSQGLNGFIEGFSNHLNHRPHDRLFILPVYFAGGTVDIKITSEEFVDRLNATGVPAEFVPDYDTLEKLLLEEDLPILIMGARDPELPLFARRLAAALCCH